ncbi:hypothetical protein [Solilutibacter silvestris]|uniref:hypothetical protein n=1 Tax=Solilutibacter silvestris TaxID=1645665 RepID=UPI000CA0867A|nr:hypothetical protein [Lysobacter silvestris]
MTDVEQSIPGIKALWDGVELSLSFTTESLSEFTFAISRKSGAKFRIEPGFGRKETETEVLTRVTDGPAMLAVKGDSILLTGSSNALGQIAQNSFSLIDLAMETGVSHMHFDSISDSDLIDEGSAALVICLELNPA